MLKSISLVILSAVFLTLSFPPFGVWPLAWIALVPLMRALDTQSPRQAFARGWLAGILFFSATLYWLINMTWSAYIPLALAVLALVLLCLYLAVYFGLFAWGYACFSRMNFFSKLTLLPALWVVLECGRDRLFSGFGWLTLGSSQTLFLPVIQIADVTGVFGISYLIVMVNLFLKAVFFPSKAGRKALVPAGLVVAVLIVSALIYGRIRIRHFSQGDRPAVRVALVQPNIPQQRKWLTAEWPKVLDELLALAERAASSRPDLMIWPETAFPGFLWEEPQSYQRIQEFAARTQVPLLLGAVTKTEGRYYNSAILLSAQGRETGRYDKRHLVPFGEFLPLRRWCPWLGDLVPIEDFSPGEKVTLFSLPGQGGRVFSTVICFEDTIARVVRPFVKQGARLLVNITNDAWFMDSTEPFLHLQSAVLRAVENRRTLIRAANTGISCVIDAAGRVTHRVHDRRSKTTFVAGTLTAPAAWQADLSFYTRYGDVFCLLCLGAVIAGFSRIKKHGNHIEH